MEVAMKKIILPIAIAACALARKSRRRSPPDVKEIMSKRSRTFPQRRSRTTVTYPPGALTKSIDTMRTPSSTCSRVDRDAVAGRGAVTLKAAKDL